MSDRSDSIDDAGVTEQLFLREALSNRKPALKPVGYCHYCSEEVHSGEQFCHEDCRDGWQIEHDAMERKYGPK